MNSGRHRLAVGVMASVLILALFGASLLHPVADAYVIDLSRSLLPPGPGGVLGTDELGRSVLARLLVGGRFSLTVMIGAACLSVSLGCALGIASAWFGGWTDRAIDSLITLFWSLPVAVFAVLVLTVLSPSLTSTLITITAVNWVGSARVVRAETLKLRDGAFVKAAQARGVPPAHVLFYEILPNLRGLLALLLGFAGAEALALEGGLAYLGIAPPPPAATWGAMLTAGLPYVATAWWIALVPSVAIVCAVAAARIASQRLEDSMFR